MSLLQTKVLPALNGKYTGKVTKFFEEENDNGGYVKVELLIENDREYTYCIFPSQINYVISSLRAQLFDNKTECTLEDVLTEAMDKDINIWFTYNSEYNRMNVAFHESKSREEIDSEEDMDI